MRRSVFYVNWKTILYILSFIPESIQYIPEKTQPVPTRWEVMYTYYGRNVLKEIRRS